MLDITLFGPVTGGIRALDFNGVDFRNDIRKFNDDSADVSLRHGIAHRRALGAWLLPMVDWTNGLIVD